MICTVSSELAGSVTWDSGCCWLPDMLKKVWTPTSIWQSFTIIAVRPPKPETGPHNTTANCWQLKVQSNFTLTQAVILTDELPVISETLSLQHSSRTNKSLSINPPISHRSGQLSGRVHRRLRHKLVKRGCCGVWGELVNEAVVN